MIQAIGHAFLAAIGVTIYWWALDHTVGRLVGFPPSQNRFSQFLCMFAGAFAVAAYQAAA